MRILILVVLLATAACEHVTPRCEPGHWIETRRSVSTRINDTGQLLKDTEITEVWVCDPDPKIPIDCAVGCEGAK